jgi:hypothetical protein
MKRDMDLVRHILVETENAGLTGTDSAALSAGDWDEPTVARHVELMKEAGLIDACVVSAMGAGPVRAVIDGLTWQGYDFLDAVRSETVWRETKSTIVEKVGTASFDVVKAVAAALAMKALGLR